MKLCVKWSGGHHFSELSGSPLKGCFNALKHIVRHAVARNYHQFCDEISAVQLENVSATEKRVVLRPGTSFPTEFGPKKLSFSNMKHTYFGVGNRNVFFSLLAVHRYFELFFLAV